MIIIYNLTESHGDHSPRKILYGGKNSLPSMAVKRDEDSILSPRGSAKRVTHTHPTDRPFVSRPGGEKGAMKEAWLWAVSIRVNLKY